MSFVRSKEIPPKSCNFYDYEVETVHTGSKVLQKVIQYLGKSGTPNKALMGGRVHIDLAGGSASPTALFPLSLKWSANTVRGKILASMEHTKVFRIITVMIARESLLVRMPCPMAEYHLNLSPMP